jgi:cell division initiation protein
MNLTPLDIQHKKFPRKLFGGYDRDAVDEFLDQVIREFELLIRENSQLKDQIEQLNEKLEQYRNLEETIHRTLVVAQETAEELRNNAKKEADLIIQEARLQAERVIEAGQGKARRIMEENADLSRAVQALRTQVRSLLYAQLQAIDGLQDPFAQAAASQMGSDREHSA